MDQNIAYIITVFQEMLPVLPRTLWICLLSFVLSVAVALFVTIVDYFQVPVLRQVCNFYVSFFRGTPLVAQLFLFYFGLPSICEAFLAITKMQAVVLGLGFNAGAYMRESFRGAILSVDKGQLEAAYSIGMSDMKVMWRIILPQSVVVAIPSLVNNLVDIIKGSSLAFTVGVIDITAAAKLRASANFKYFHAYIALMFLYWIIVLVLERGQAVLERSLSQSR